MTIRTRREMLKSAAQAAAGASLGLLGAPSLFAQAKAG